MIDLLAALTWDPGVRGVLTVAVAVLILCGSVYLILATNSGPRLGFQIALTGLMGWMLIMGVIWAIYGIGYQGRLGTWHVKEVNYGTLSEAQTEIAQGLPSPSDLPDVEELIAANPELAEQFPVVEGQRRPSIADLLAVDPTIAETWADIVPEEWEVLSAADRQLGEAQAAASAYLVETRQLFGATSEFVIQDSYVTGGKGDLDPDAGLIERAMFKVGRIVTWPLGNPTKYAVVQVQAVVPQEALPGEPPPLPVADEDAAVVSVVMVRDLGTRRLPAVGLTIFSGIVFALLCESLHRRDKLVAEARAAAAKG